MSAIRDSIDSNVEALRAVFEAEQEEFLQTYGRYWQGRLTHSELPEDGEAVPVDNLTKPNSEPFGWQGFMDCLPPAIRVALQVDNYDGPEGMGFTVTMTYKEDGVTWRKVLNHGPEVRRETDWQELIPVP